MALSDYDRAELQLRSQLAGFLTDEQASHWLHVCHHAQIKAALKRFGHKHAAYTCGTRGMFGLREEIAERRGKLPNQPKSRKTTKQTKLDQLFREFT